MQRYPLTIVSPRGIVFLGDVYRIVFPAWEGEMMVLKGHISWLGRLRKGIIRVCLDVSSAEKKFTIERGILEVMPDKVRVFVYA